MTPSFLPERSLPDSLRLMCTRPLRGKHPPVPFGLRWSEGGDGVGVLLELPTSWPPSGLGEISVVSRQVPDPASLPSGRLVVVLPRSAPARPWLGRLLGARAWAAGGVRASALLAKGYVGIGAGVDPKTRMDLVWGYA